jgi:branched-chain amino acid transport system substrate-binding protein
VNDLWKKVGSNQDLRKRILGTVPSTHNHVFWNFKQAYKTKFTDGTSPAVFGAAGAYDATYLLGYATVANGSLPVTGANLAKALRREVPPGTAMGVGADSINPIFKILESGKNIDFDGASGPLDFDLSTGDAPSDIQLWCLPKDPSGNASAAQNSGEFFDATTGKIAGSIDPAICGG